MILPSQMHLPPIQNYTVVGEGKIMTLASGYIPAYVHVQVSVSHLFGCHIFRLITYYPLFVSR